MNEELAHRRVSEFLEAGGFELTDDEEDMVDWMESGSPGTEVRELAFVLYRTKAEREMVDDWIAATEQFSEDSKRWSRNLVCATWALVLVTAVLAIMEAVRIAGVNGGG